MMTDKFYEWNRGYTNINIISNKKEELKKVFRNETNKYYGVNGNLSRRR